MSTLEFAEMQKIVQNKKKSNLDVLGCKFVIFVIFVKKVLSSLKSASSNLSKCKVLCKIKNP